MPKPILQCVLLVASLAMSHAQAPAPRGKHTQGFQQLAARADAARDAGRLDEAQALYQRALAARPTWTEGWWSLGTILYDNDNYPRAAAALARLVALDPKNGTAHLMLALCQYQLGSYDRSLRNIQKAEELGIRKDDALLHVLQYHKGMLLLRKRNYENAMITLRRPVEDGVHSDQLDLALGMDALLVRPQDLPSEVSDKRQIVLRAGQAEGLSILKKYDETRERYSALVKEFPEYPNIHYAYGHFLLAIDNPDEAVVQFQQEIRIYPKHIRARVQIAAIRYRTDSRAGIPYAMEVIALQPHYPFGHYLPWVAVLGLRRSHEGCSGIADCGAHGSTRGTIPICLGNAYAKVGRKRDAARVRAAFRRLSREQPSPGSTAYGEEQPLRLDSGARPTGPAPKSDERQP